MASTTACATPWAQPRSTRLRAPRAVTAGRAAPSARPQKEHSRGDSRPPVAGSACRGRTRHGRQDSAELEGAPDPVELEGPPWRAAELEESTPPARAARRAHASAPAACRSPRVAAVADARTPPARTPCMRSPGRGMAREEGRPRVCVRAVAGLAPPHRAPPSAGLGSSTPADVRRPCRPAPPPLRRPYGPPRGRIWPPSWERGRGSRGTPCRARGGAEGCHHR
ncbi:atherin-like [Panicum virgatum]|uniref:atherin-like n=1 Tax=Panicum virgatum TaxID=38727 RepID=UPI0019D5DD44|nr:atherin-like [Panicum virgatum]